MPDKAKPLLSPLTLDNLDNVQPLAAKIFPPNYILLRPDYFGWQFQRAADLFSGGDGNPGSWIAEENGQATSLWLATRAPMWLEGKRFNGTWGHGWFADPESMGSGLPLIVQEIEANGVFGGMNLSLMSVGVKASLFKDKLQWVEEVRLFGVINANETNKLLMDDDRSALLYLNTLRRTPKRGPVQVKEITEFDADYESVWNAMRETISFTTDRTAEYMNWRFFEEPFLDYHCRRFDTDRGPSYFIWRNEKFEDCPRIARLVDVIGMPDAIVESYPAFCKILKEQGVAMCDYFGTHAATLAALRQGGMRQAVTIEGLDLPRLFAPLAVEIRKTVNLAVIANADNAGPWLYDSSKWHVTKSDANQDRYNP